MSGSKEHDDVIRIHKKLEKIISRKDSSSCAQALDLLKSLQSIPINLEVLQKTRIGMTVNNLRKSIKDEDVTSLSKTLIKSWKKLLPDNDAKGNSNPTNGDASKSSTTDPKKAPIVAKASAPAPNKPVTPNPPFRQSSFPANTTNDVRLKCREMLTNALKHEDFYDADESLYEPEDLAAKIEDCIFKEFKDTNPKYKTRIRSRVANLNDKKNPDLKLNVLRGSIKPDKIAVMTADEMASREMQDLRNKFTKEAINDHQLSQTSGTKTDLLTCPACKKKNCTYNQVQTRSADEPMTTFCLCNECGKRWKFC